MTCRRRSKRAGRWRQADARGWLRELLVIAEVALALVLLVGAGLLIRSFIQVLNVTPGFESRNMLTMSAPAVGAKYADPAQVRAHYDELLRRVAVLPGVEAVAVVSNLPFGGEF